MAPHPPATPSPAFLRLPQEKQRRILSAGFAAFGRAGYKKTAMADIAGAAGVSKASLFHYFGTKHQLWLHLYHTGIAEMSDQVFADISHFSDDLFERLWKVQEIKLRIGAAYPGMFAFFTRSIHEDAPTLLHQRDQLYHDYVSRGFAALLSGVDLTRLKPGIEVNDVIRIITWVSEGYVAGLAPLTADTSDIRRVGERYIALLKPAFYKEEYL